MITTARFLTGTWVRIAAIDLEEQEVIVQFAEGLVNYDYADMDEITLALVGHSA